MQIQAHRRSIMVDRCRIHLQRDDIVCPILRAHVRHLRARAGDEVIYAARESGHVLIHGAEMFDYGDLREFVCDQE
jgi:hypothetical protein